MEGAERVVLNTVRSVISMGNLRHNPMAMELSPSVVSLVIKVAFESLPDTFIK